MKRRFITATALIGAASMLMAACSQGGSASSEAGTSLTLRLWDDQAAQAYEAALPAFTEETGITVNVEVVPWSDYFTGLRSELAAGPGPDVFWSNTNNYTEYARGARSSTSTRNSPPPSATAGFRAPSISTRLTESSTVSRSSPTRRSRCTTTSRCWTRPA